MIEEIKVGIADLNVTNYPNKLITVGLGSCIGITFYDKINKNGGLLHIMLPSSTQFSNISNPLKFADLGIPILLKRIEEMGSQKKNLVAKIAGGASMFNFTDNNMNMDIGNRNTISVKHTLNSLGISLTGEDTGGNKGRTMILDTESGIVQIRTVGVGTKEL